MISRRFMFPKDKSAWSLGRNGMLQTIGVEITEVGKRFTVTPVGYTELVPITSKGERGRCKIQIPVESCPYTALDAVMKKMGKDLPTLMGIHPFLDQMITRELSGKDHA
jgi:hypothetical protein